MATKLEPRITSDFGVKGVDTGLQCIEAQGQADYTKRTTLTAVALELAGLAQQTEDFLGGYEHAFKTAKMTDGTTRKAKSEARTICKATAILVNNKGLEAATTILESLTVGFNAFVQAMRDIITIEETGNEPTGKTDTSAKKIKADDLVTLEKRMRVTPVSTVNELMQAAVKVSLQQAGQPEMLVERLADFADALAKNTDKFWAKLGSDIVGQVEKARKHVATEKARAIAQEQKRLDAETAAKKPKEPKKPKAKAAKRAPAPTPAIASEYPQQEQPPATEQNQATA